MPSCSPKSVTPTTEGWRMSEATRASFKKSRRWRSRSLRA